MIAVLVLVLTSFIALIFSVRPLKIYRSPPLKMDRSPSAAVKTTTYGEGGGLTSHRGQWNPRGLQRWPRDLSDKKPLTEKQVQQQYVVVLYDASRV